MNPLYNEKYRLQFHFSPKEKWMNDPNGLVYFNDEYHLFFQFHPFGTTWGPMHWGHAVSKDLIHWEQLPIALYPDEHGAIFSGSAVVDWNNTSGFFPDEPGLVAIYTSADKNPDSDMYLQRQSLAYSKDNGRTWTKYDGNPVLSDASLSDFRDPKVSWHEETNRWVMALATGQSITVFTSRNLKDWEFASEFGKHAGSHDGVWECPDLFRLPVEGEPSNQKWVLLVSIGDNPEFKEGSRTQYFIGDFDGTTFINHYSNETILWLDHGRDNYAGVSWSDMPTEDSRRVYIGWMSNWRYANQVPTEGWRSAMTLPRELSLISNESGYQLVQKVVAEVDTIRKGSQVYNGLLLEPNQPTSYKLTSSLMEINLEFETLTSTSITIALQNNDEERTLIRYDAARQQLAVDPTNAGVNHFSEAFATVQEASLKMEDHRIKLQVFIDASSIEVFANGGKQAITSLIFPKVPYNQLVLLSYGGNTQISSLKLTELDSIWGK